MAVDQERPRTKILMVREGAGSKHHLEARLRSIGYFHYVHAAPGEAAVRAAAVEQPNIVLLDISQPGPIDGIETAKAIWSQHEIPVVIIADQVDIESLEPTDPIPPLQYVFQPVRDRDLKATIDTALYIGRLNKQRGRAEEGLNIYSDILNNMPCGLLIFQHDPPDRLILLDGNPESERLKGIKIDEWRGRELSEIRPMTSLIEMKQSFLNVLKTKKGFETQDLSYGDNRLTGAFRITAFSMPLRRMGVVFENIMKRKKAEEEHRILSAIVESSNNFTGLASMDGRITYLNKAGRRLVGLESLAEAKTTTIFDYVSEDFQPVLMNEAIPAASSNGFWNGEHRIRHFKTKVDIDVDVSFLALGSDDEGKPTALALIMRDITERKKTENALRESERRFKELTDLLPEVIFEMEASGKLAFTNQTAFKFFGYSQKDFEGGLYCLDMLVSEDRKRAADEIKKLLAGGESRLNEYTALCKDGRTRPVIMRSTPFVRNEQFVGLRGLMIDMTEHKKAETALKASEKTLKSIFRAAPIGIGLVSNRVIKQVNDRFCHMLGYSPDELIGQNVRFLYPSQEEYEWVGREKYEQITDKGTGSVETRLLCKYGRVIDVLLSSTPLEPTDLIKGVTFTALDITERKKAEEQREHLFNLSIDMLCVAGFDGRFKQLNPAWSQTLGWTGEELMAKPLLDLVHPEDMDATAAAGEKLTKGQTIHAFENRYKAKDGSYRWMSWNAIPRLEKQLIYAVARDVTNQKIIEQERKKLEIQLCQSQKMEALGTLAGGIAHDFNNVLSAIMGYSELTLLGVPETETAHKYVKLTLHAANRAKDLVKQILTFSRYTESQRIAVEITPVVKEVLKLVRSSLPTTIEIRQDIETAAGCVLADTTQIYQVIMNLCTNAAHAMKGKGGIIEVKLSEITLDKNSINKMLAPGKYLQLTVSDTGHGMNKQTLERIFEPYFTTKKPGEGTGMGLAVAHGIVKNHGGDIKVYSELGMGATFYVYLPITAENTETEQSLMRNVPAGAESILYVDDEELLVDIGQQMLKRLGYSVSVRTNGLKALEDIRTSPYDYDLVITDQTMPKITGAELARKIMQIRPDLPVIICTGFSESITAEEAEEIGVKAFLMKPLALQDLGRIIRKILDKSKQP